MLTEQTSEIRNFRRALRHLERFVTANVRDNSTCCGVTPTQCHVLLKAEETGEVASSELREYLGLDKSSLSRTLDGLTRLGLLERKESSEDRRSHIIALTKRGKMFVDRLNAECDDYYRPIIETLPGDIRNRILEDFEALFEAFSREGKKPGKKRCCGLEDRVDEENTHVTN